MIHPAPVPYGLAFAAKLDGVAEADVPAQLAAQTPDQWILTLRRWLAVDPARKSKTIAGPAWWYAAHCVALNPTNTIAPNKFIGVWLGSFPCRICRIGARVYIARKPIPGWLNFQKWLSDMHDYVTSRK